jgi:hypothetical protein
MTAGKRGSVSDAVANRAGKARTPSTRVKKPRPAAQQQGGANQESARSHRALPGAYPRDEKTSIDKETAPERAC